MDSQTVTAAALLSATLAIALATGCSNDTSDSRHSNLVDAATAPTAASRHATPTTEPGTRPASEPEAQEDVQPLVLTDAVLERYARGLVKEAEIIRRPGRGTHYGVTVTGSVSGGESGEVLEAAGMTARQYLEVRTLVDPVFTTLNFQGKIGPPRSIDLDAASPEFRQRMASDPLDQLPPESADVLRRNMDRLVPLWSDIVGLTAQHG
ncbi:MULTISPECIES: hypothetical protein [unclassified Luteimonas]